MDRATQDALSQIMDKANAALDKVDAEIQKSGETSTEAIELAKTVSNQLQELQEQFNTTIKAAHDRHSIPGLDLDTPEGITEAVKDFSLSRACFGFVEAREKGGNWPAKINGRSYAEKDILDYYAKVQDPNIDSQGGFLIPAQMADLIPLLRANTVAVGLGARVMTGLTGAQVTFPKFLGGATAEWVATGKAVVGTSVTFGMSQMRPKPIMAMCKLGEDLVRQANPSADAIIREDMARATGEAIDLGILKGDGGEGEPVGILTSDINSVSLATINYGPAAGALAWSGHDTDQDIENVTELLEDLMVEVEADNAWNETAMGWTMHPRARRKLRKARDVMGKPVLTDPNITQILDDGTTVNRRSIMGYPVMTTTLLDFGTATDDIIFGNWSEVIIGEWGSMEVLPSREAGDAFTKREIWIRSTRQVDCLVRHGSAFVTGAAWDNT